MNGSTITSAEIQVTINRARQSINEIRDAVRHAIATIEDHPDELEAARMLGQLGDFLGSYQEHAAWQRTRIALRLHATEHLSYGQIAQLFNISKARAYQIITAGPLPEPPLPEEIDEDSSTSRLRQARRRPNAAGPIKRPRPAQRQLVEHRPRVPVTTSWTSDEGEPRSGFVLYRYFDVDDRLLYVGLTYFEKLRWLTHASGSTWVEFAHHGHLEWFAKAEQVAAAERVAIRSEQPLFNRQHNDSPEATRRLVEYLIAKDRADLLAPQITHN